MPGQHCHGGWKVPLLHRKSGFWEITVGSYHRNKWVTIKKSFCETFRRQQVWSMMRWQSWLHVHQSFIHWVEMVHAHFQMDVCTAADFWFRGRQEWTTVVVLSALVLMLALELWNALKGIYNIHPQDNSYITGNNQLHLESHFVYIRCTLSKCILQNDTFRTKDNVMIYLNSRSKSRFGRETRWSWTQYSLFVSATAQLEELRIFFWDLVEECACHFHPASWETLTFRQF